MRASRAASDLGQRQGYVSGVVQLGATPKRVHVRHTRGEIDRPKQNAN